MRSPTTPATRRAPSTRRSAARRGCSSRCSTTSSTAPGRHAALVRAGDPGSQASLRALADQPIDARNARFLLLSIEFWVHAAREPALLDAFSERYRRLRASLAELAPPDSPLDPQRWALVTLALSNGFALERLIDPDGVPNDLMADVQARLLQAQR